MNGRCEEDASRGEYFLGRAGGCWSIAGPGRKVRAAAA